MTLLHNAKVRKPLVGALESLKKRPLPGVPPLGGRSTAQMFRGCCGDAARVASIVVSWNPFNGGQHSARRQAAKADVSRLRARLAETEDLVRLDVRQAHEAATVAFRAIETAEAQLAAARRSFQLVQRRWEEGLASPIEFLDARTALTNAELNRSVTIYRYAIRHVDLERAAALRDLDQNE